MLLGAAIVVVCVVALLAVPVDITFAIQRRETLGGQVKLVWMFGLVRWPVPLGRPKRATRKRRQRKKPRARTPGSGRRVMAMLKTEAFRWRLMKLVIDVGKAIHVRRLNLRLRVGLDDPADTGRLWGVVGPVAGLLATLPRTRVALEPDFSNPAFAMLGNGEVRLIPVQFAYIALVFLISPATLRTLWSMRTSRHR